MIKTMRKAIGFTAVIATLFLSQAVASPVTKNNVRDQKALEAITKRNSEFSQGVTEQNLTKLAAIYDTNVVFQAQDFPTIRGRDGVLQYLGLQVQAGVTGISLTTEEIRPLRDLKDGYLEYEEIGSNVLTFANGLQVPGKYTVIWRFYNRNMKDPLVIRDSFSLSVALP